MNIERIFPRLPGDNDGDFRNASIKAWRERMDQLLYSDPMELLQFVGDILIALAAKAEDEDLAWEAVMGLLERSGEIPERDEVVNMVRERWHQQQAHLSEHIVHPTGDILSVVYEMSRTAPWPRDM